ncbi:FAD-dependent monooxygenase [Xylanibacillus composti]|uniref:FAD-dependent oxidoreductase n=1 Tax=Xylanibacillus composti TaxID=1572762 RepID=A0A8J4M3A4_9BACL|nr:FAD-dependent monooxygenase [Xylanibacillus composti]MDT9726732.1 FAD-dependent monooxygenase [Xylanibacillus composti]GIQ69336.1 FAD-dependent oxidoreductase [Xylanibacillus composti]
MYDFIIVGARCAGAATALLLAEHGFRILVMDQFAKPGPTLSTHIIGETEIYDKLRVHERMSSSGIPAMTRMRIDLEGRVFESGITVTSRALSVRRELLDQWLFEELGRFPNIEIWTRTKAVSTVSLKQRVIGVRFKHQSGRQDAVYGKVIIGADGRRSAIARAVQPARLLGSSENHLAVYYAYIRGLQPLPIPTVEWYWLDQGIMLCNPLDQGLHCIAVMLPEQQFREWGQAPAANFLKLLRKIATFAPRMDNAVIHGRLYGTAGIESYIRKPYGEKWALVGDAGAHLHPVSGTGIDNAVCSAAMLATELAKYRKGACTWQEAMQAYTRQRDERIIPQYHNCLRTLERSTQTIEAESLQTLGVLCTFPGLVKELGHRAPGIYSKLMEGPTYD